MTERNIPSQLSYESLLHSLYRVMYSREAPNDQVQFNVEQIVNHNISLDDIIRSFADSEERLEIERARAIAGINSEIYDSQDLIFKRDVALFDRDGNLISGCSNRLGSKYDLLKHLENRANTGIFLDVGANVGQTLVEAFAFDKSIKYFGFEPNPTAFRYLKALAEANALPATIFPWACASASAPLRLYTLGGADTSATTRPETRGDMYTEGHGQWIASLTLDSMVQALPLEQHFILKIDVEGAEYQVMSGASDMIHKYRPVVICEVLHAHRAEEIDLNDQNKLAIEEFCRTSNYNIYQQIFAEGDFYGDGRLLGLKLVTGFEKSKLYIDNRTSNDYVFAPSELGDISYDSRQHLPAAT